MLVSVHVPKAGGTALRQILQQHFEARLFADYGEDPGNPVSRRNLDPVGYMSRKLPLPDGAECVHGHFHPGKYDLGNAFLFTVLRHPVDTIVSTYYYRKFRVRVKSRSLLKANQCAENG